MAEPELRPRASSSSEDESEPFVDASAARDTPDPVASTANDAPDPARPSPPSPPLPLPSHPPVYSITSTCTKCATRFQFEPPGPAASHSVSCYACGHGNIVSESPSGKSAAKNTGSKKRKQGSDAEPLETEYYDLLKVVPTATAGEIKKGYYFMAQKYHPDKVCICRACDFRFLIGSCWNRSTTEPRRPARGRTLQIRLESIPNPL